jgi:hypothetical protein
MATTYTARAKLRKGDQGDRNWHGILNANADVIDSTNAVGAFAVTSKEVPSTSLAVAVSGGTYIKADGETYATFAGAASLALPASSTTMIWLTDAGSIDSGGAWPSGTPCLRLAVATTDASKVTAIADARTPYRVS